MKKKIRFSQIFTPVDTTIRVVMARAIEDELEPQQFIHAITMSVASSLYLFLYQSGFDIENDSGIEGLDEEIKRAAIFISHHNEQQSI